MTLTRPRYIEDLCRRSHENALARGFVTAEGDSRPFHLCTLLNQSEVSEALEEWRDHKPANEIYYEVKSGPGQPHTCMSQKELLARAESGLVGSADVKPCGIPVELADLVIRVCQWVGSNKQIEPFMRRWNAVRSVLPGTASFDCMLGRVSNLLALADIADHGEFGIAGLHDREHYLAAALWGVFDFCEGNHIDLWAAIEMKENYNASRPFRHGNKKA